MKILLINSNTIQPPITPLGLAYIATASIKAGHEVKILDLNPSDNIKNDIKMAILSYCPDVIGISIRNIDNVTMLHSVYYIPEVKKIINLCKRFTEASIILGGPGFSIMPKEIMSETKISFGVVGEGETAFIELLKCIEAGEQAIDIHGVIYKVGDKFINNKHKTMPSEELDKSPLPARELIDNMRYLNDGGMGNIQTKRGCNRRCLYCTYPMIEGKNLRFRSPEKVVAEIEVLKKMGIDYLHFSDSTFNIPNEHAINICKEMIKRGISIKYTPYMSPHSPSKKLLSLLKKTGCDGIIFGTDTVSEKMLINLKKDFTVSDIYQSAKFCKEFKIPFSLNLLCGGPGETKETIRESLDNISRIKPVAAGAMIGIRCYPKTGLWEIACDEGQIDRKANLLEPFYYVSPSINKEWLINTLQEYSLNNDNFFIPTDKKGYHTDDLVIEIYRSGFRGPFWEVNKKLKEIMSLKEGK
jgi:radical SAM superfamily enzyme YgiQ (UPF0313 family)